MKALNGSKCPSSERLTEDEICERLVFSRGVKRVPLKKPGMFQSWWGLAKFIALAFFVGCLYYGLFRAVWG